MSKYIEDTNYKKRKLWQEGKIYRCPVCKRYFEKADTPFICNVKLCDECRVVKGNRKWN